MFSKRETAPSEPLNLHFEVPFLSNVRNSFQLGAPKFVYLSWSPFYTVYLSWSPFYAVYLSWSPFYTAYLSWSPFFAVYLSWSPFYTAYLSWSPFYTVYLSWSPFYTVYLSWSPFCTISELISIIHCISELISILHCISELISILHCISELISILYCISELISILHCIFFTQDRERNSGLTWNHFSPPLSIFRVAMETQNLLGFWSSGHSHQRDGTGNHLLSRALPRVSLLWPRSHSNVEHSKTVDCHQTVSSIPSLATALICYPDRFCSVRVRPITSALGDRPPTEFRLLPCVMLGTRAPSWHSKIQPLRSVIHSFNPVLYCSFCWGLSGVWLLKVKVKVTCNMPLEAYRGGRGVELLILNLGASASITPRKSPATRCTRGWKGVERS
jgi:hypothetical protein